MLGNLIKQQTSIIAIYAVLFFTGFDVYAQAVNPDTVFDSSHFAEAQQIKAIVEQPESSLDFAKSKLEIDKIIDPSINVNENLKKLDAMVMAINSMLLPGSSSNDKMQALRKYLYEPGAWNNYQPYQYDFSDPMGTKVVNKLLPTYLTTRKGNCISMPFMFIVLGQRLGIDVTASTAPSHVLVKYTDSSTGITSNLETTSGANPSRDVWYQETMKVTDAAIKNEIYLKKLSKRETLAVMATVLAEYYYEKQEYEKSMMISDVVLKYYNRDVDVMIMKGSLFYKLLNKYYLSKYSMPKLIPVDERRYFEFLSINNLHWFQKAESLGWRQPTKEEDANYLNMMKNNPAKVN